MTSSLVRRVRLLTNADDDAVPTMRIVEALEANSVAFTNAQLCWNQVSTDKALIPIGRYLVEDSSNADDGHLEAVTLRDGTGTLVTDFTVTQKGLITVTEEELEGVTLYATGTAYDLYGACADIVTLIIGQHALSYDFKRGDQTFNRSQIITNLKELRKSFRAQSIPRRRGAMTMRDQAGVSWY